ncbi:diguanylate cyclase [Methylonatrum kenyense]|uniref:diguanylate cyclase n=1 Tax=Methylonatrum kenyense TaxID=455253 RepID=UPI0020BFA707|nr:diguanylate cyclase [Methylonatrum kenyense]MCK8517156.1 diguanylate cyclase [Methylonatrum kenyense]
MTTVLWLAPDRRRARQRWPRLGLLLLVPLLVLAPVPLAVADEPEPLVVAQDHAWPPFAFEDQRGEPQGALIEVWQDIGRQLDRPVEFLLVDWGDSIEAVRDGRADVHGGLFQSPERERFLEFGADLLPLSTYLFVIGNLMVESVEELTGMPVGVVDGSFEREFMRSEYPQLRLQSFKNNDAMVRAAMDGELEAFAADYPVALYLLDRHGDPARFRPMTRLYAQQLKFAVAGGNSALRDSIDAAVADLGDEGIRRSAQRWVRTETVEVVPGWLWPLLTVLVLGTAVAVLFRDQRLLKRRVAEKTATLEEREALFRTLADSSAVGLFIGVDGKTRAVNHAMADLFGVSRSQLVGHSFLPYVHPEDRERVRQRVQRIMDGELEGGRFEDRLVRPDGRVVWVESVVRQAVYEGRPALAGTVIDITERKRYEQARARLDGVQRLSTEVSSLFLKSSVNDIHAGIDYLLREAGQLMGAQRAYVFRFLDGGRIMTNTHEWCAAGVRSVFDECQNLVVADMPWWQSQMRERIHRFNPLMIPELNELPEEAAAEKQFLGSQDIRALLCVPIGHQGRVSGFLGFDYLEPQAFSGEESHLMLTLAGLLTEALERNRTDRALLRESRTDALTGLYNRRYLDARLQELIADGEAGVPSFALAMVDLDHFKEFNDTHGHQAGDALLRSVSTTLRQNQRSDDVVVRYGGEEFAVLIGDVTIDEAVQAASRYIDALRSMVCRWRGNTFRLTASAGVAASSEFAPGQVTADALIALADHRLYRAKRAGRDQVCGDDAVNPPGDDD